MVVEYVKIHYTENEAPINIGAYEPSQNQVGDLKEIKAIGVRFCCIDMAHHFRLDHVGFGSRPDEVYRNTVAEVFIRVEGGAQRFGGENACGEPQNPKPNTDLAIPYCPWCREPVLTNEIASL